MNGRQCAPIPIPVFVSMSAFLAVADITITIAVIRLAVRRRPAYVHIETNGLYSCGTELLSLSLFVFVECWGWADARTSMTSGRRRGGGGGGSSLIDLRRRPKQRAPEATPRILPRFRLWPPAVGVREESAVAGRESEVPRADLCVNGIMSSRELAEETFKTNQYRCAGAPWRSHGKQGERNVR